MISEPRREPVSIICVFNDLAVRRSCLDRSIEAQREHALDIDFVPIDNIGNPFSSAGAALNHGASLARHDYLVFVHQDVYLHSLPALEEAAGRLADSPSIGVLGPVGITSDGRIIGQMRDRVVLIGESATEPVDVDSLDEVLFMIPRSVWKDEPLIEQPELAWHAYAVEYAVRMRARGLRSAALDIPVTHNSLTVNLDKLDVAHRAVAMRYPDAVPVRTTCGTVRTDPPALRSNRFLTPHLWRRSWLRDSLIIRKDKRAVGDSPVVRGDIRLDIDDLLRGVDGPPLQILNVIGDAAFGRSAAAELTMARRDRHVVVRALRLDAAKDLLSTRPAEQSLLVTNLGGDDVGQLRPGFAADTHLVGYHEAMGYWVLVGPVTTLVPRQWASRAALPLGRTSLAY